MYNNTYIYVYLETCSILFLFIAVLPVFIFVHTWLYLTFRVLYGRVYAGLCTHYSLHCTVSIADRLCRYTVPNILVIGIFEVGTLQFVEFLYYCRWYCRYLSAQTDFVQFTGRSESVSALSQYSIVAICRIMGIIGLQYSLYDESSTTDWTVRLRYLMYSYCARTFIGTAGRSYSPYFCMEQDPTATLDLCTYLKAFIIIKIICVLYM